MKRVVGSALAGCAALLGCAPSPCGPGPEAWDPPSNHPDLTDDDNDWLFDPTHVSRIDLALDDDAVAALSAERLFSRPRLEVRGNVTIDGQLLADVGVQLRGGLGSFQRWDGKPQWGLDFNLFREDQRFHGLEGLALNNADEDPSYLKDLAGMEVYRLAGSPYARVGYAQLFVNDVDKGLMIVVEPTDDRWMRRSFGRADGNLYDGTYAFNGWTPYFLDVGDGRDEAFDLLEGEDVGSADIGVVSAAVEATRTDGALSRISALVDLPTLSAMLAAEWFIGNADGYGSFANNYRLYLPTGSRAVLAPWDMGATFPPEGRDDTLWERPNGNLADLCFADAACAADQRARRDALTDAVATSPLPDTLVAVREHIRAAAEGDPVGVCDAARVSEAQDGVLAWFGR